MNPALQHLQECRPFFEKRALLLSALRRSFFQRGFLEVTTPSLIPSPAQEEYIETIPAANGFLRPSPELEMKALLAAGYERIYQIGPCWRADEHGRKHRTEFTMLEYYVKSFNYNELRTSTTDLIAEAALLLNGSFELQYSGKSINLAPEAAQVITVEQAFAKYGRCTMITAQEQDIFDEVMVVDIEPNLGNGHLTYLTDYPADRAALARKKADNPQFSERWELYISGLELANAFGELTDAAEQKSRFAAAAKFRAVQNMNRYPKPELFYAALEQGLPECSGSALGIDRLAMIFCNRTDIADVGFSF